MFKIKFGFLQKNIKGISGNCTTDFAHYKTFTYTGLGLHREHTILSLLFVYCFLVSVLLLPYQSTFLQGIKFQV